jgi:alginate O-acetyltransferase complex protein AlgI
LMATMLLGGLWHGANWTFVIWGGIHGGWLSVERFLTRSKTSIRVLNRLAALAAVGLGWIFFRAKTVSEALHMVANAGHFQWQRQYGPEILFLLLVSSLGLAIDFRLEACDEEYVFQRSSLAVPVVTALAMSVLMIAFAASETNAFLYFQF